MNVAGSGRWRGGAAPEEIAAEIARSIDFLEAEGDIPERQRSIRAVCDYAWQMIDERRRAAGVHEIIGVSRRIYT